MAQAAWRDKAERLIAEMAREAWERTNRLPNGRVRKKHVPYTLPAIADELVDCLGQNDEERAKGLFLTLIDIPELSRPEVI